MGSSDSDAVNNTHVPRHASCLMKPWTAWHEQKLWVVKNNCQAGVQVFLDSSIFPKN